MASIIKKVTLAVLCLIFHVLTVNAQVVVPTQETNNQKVIDKLRKEQEKAQQLQQKIQAKKQQADKKAQQVLGVQDKVSKMRQALSGLSSSADSLQNIKLFNKHRRDSLRWKNFYFGGDFGLSVGGKQIFVNVSPLIGFKLSDKFSIGGGSIFQYLRTQVILIDPTQGVNIKQTAQTLIYGGRGFTRLFLHKKFFAQGDFELINVQLPTTDGSKIRNWVPGAWAGAGYNFDIGRGMGLNLILSYNFLYKDGKSPYTSPLDVRVGIQF